MKKILSALLFAGILIGCYDDKGNYDYTLDSMNEIKSVEFTPAVAASAGGDVIEVRQPLNEKDIRRCIKVKLEQTIEKNSDNLDFYWQRTYVKDGINIIDTIYTKDSLEVILPLGKAMEYDIFLQIYDRTTTLSHYSAFKIKTRPLFKNSLFVLHGNEGDRKLGNIEIVGNDTTIYTDIKLITKDNYIYNNAHRLDYSTYYNISTSGQQRFANSLTVFSEDEGTRVYDPFGMIAKSNSNQVFKPDTADLVIKKIIKTGDQTNYSQYKIALSEDGYAYIGNYVHALYKPGYSNELGNSDPLHQNDYYITAATITENHFIFWDAKNGRFLYSAKNSGGMAENEEDAQMVNNNLSSNSMLDANVDFSTLTVSPEGMTAVMGYINYRDNYEVQKPYFIFKDESSGEFYRYELTALSSEKTRASNDDEKIPVYAISGERMKNFAPGENLESITYNSWFTTNYLFYAEGSTVYRYNASNGDRSVVYKAPLGYDVTMIKFRTEDYNKSNYEGDLGRILSIGLYDTINNNGAIAEIRFTTAADVDDDFVPLFFDKDDKGNKWGRIKDMQFAREYMYNIPNY